MRSLIVTSVFHLQGSTSSLGPTHFFLPTQIVMTLRPEAPLLKQFWLTQL